MSSPSCSSASSSSSPLLTLMARVAGPPVLTTSEVLVSRRLSSHSWSEEPGGTAKMKVVGKPSSVLLSNPLRSPAERGELVSTIALVVPVAMVSATVSSSALGSSVAVAAARVERASAMIPSQSTSVTSAKLVELSTPSTVSRIPFAASSAAAAFASLALAVSIATVAKAAASRTSPSVVSALARACFASAANCFASAEVCFVVAAKASALATLILALASSEYVFHRRRTAQQLQSTIKISKTELK
mmetsp:Transcript_27556/g.55616  ORF Transcript_27556/g.55616 Transcript_27556/m.55616 type:complete len:246 (-) Transcript_27556:346-1083(-)